MRHIFIALDWVFRCKSPPRFCPLSKALLESELAALLLRELRWDWKKIFAVLYITCGQNCFGKQIHFVMDDCDRRWFIFMMVRWTNTNSQWLIEQMRRWSILLEMLVCAVSWLSLLTYGLMSTWNGFLVHHCRGSSGCQPYSYNHVGKTSRPDGWTNRQETNQRKTNIKDLSKPPELLQSFLSVTVYRSRSDGFNIHLTTNEMWNVKYNLKLKK